MCVTLAIRSAEPPFRNEPRSPRERTSSAVEGSSASNSSTITDTRGESLALQRGEEVNVLCTRPNPPVLNVSDTHLDFDTEGSSGFGVVDGRVIDYKIILVRRGITEHTTGPLDSRL